MLLKEISDPRPYSVASQYKGQNDVFVHYSNSDRLGINPNSQIYYNPVGLWSYPINHILDRAQNNNGSLKNVELYSERKYVIVFKDTGTFLELSKPDKSKLNILFQNMKKFAIDQGGEEAAGHFDKVMTSKRGDMWTKIKRFFYIFEDELGPSKYMTEVMRQSGIDAVVDRGGHQITTDLPTQAIHFNESTLTKLHTLQNI